MITEIRHPAYRAKREDWTLWRDVYESGTDFINSYLKQFSRLETVENFAQRKEVSYSPSFASVAINEVRNSIYERMVDIIREGGEQTYKDACDGDLFGVDLYGSSMNGFIGTKVLPELLVMGKVGIYVDMPAFAPSNLMESNYVRPYLYLYRAEDICNWKNLDPIHFSAVVLKECYVANDPKYDLPSEEQYRYRYLHLADGGMYCYLYDENDKLLAAPAFVSIPRIPFYVLEISDSLLKDVARYQVSLLNLASSDISYALRSNFPFYTEQRDWRAEDRYTQGDTEIKLGTSGGRAYPPNMERPGFIHPSSEPLEISIKKQEQLKTEIRQLVHLAVSGLTPGKQASAESKGMDRQSLESGLSYIGLELERGERLIAESWKMYMRSKNAITVKYPEKYNLKTEEERQAEAEKLTKLMTIIPSRTYQREIAKQLSKVLLGHKVSIQVLDKIYKEIETAPGLTSDYEAIAKDLEGALVDQETASQLRGYPEGVVEKAKKEHVERLKQIQMAQAPLGAARGIDDQSVDPRLEAKLEKVNKNGRGEE